MPLVSVELGASSEPTALCVVERVLVPTGEKFNQRYMRGAYEEVTACERVNVVYQVRHLERFSPPYRYAGVAKHTAELVASLDECLVTVDITRTGRPTFSTIRNAIKRELFGRLPTFFPTTVSWSSLGATHSASSGFVVPRRDLVSTALGLFESERLKISSKLEISSLLVEEFAGFKPSKDPKDDLEGWRLGRNDDLVLGVSLAAWVSETYVKREEYRPIQKTINWNKREDMSKLRSGLPI